MGIENVILVKQEMRELLKSTLTCDNMENVIAALEDVMTRYDVSRIDRAEIGDDTYLATWIEALRVEGRSEKTIARYTYYVTRLLEQSGVNTREITVYHIRKFLSDEKARGLMDSTVNNIWGTFNSYFGWLYREELIQKNPMRNIRRMKTAKKVRLEFSNIELEKLRKATTCLRDEAIIRFLTDSGCRVSELIELNRNQIDIDGRKAMVHGKGDKERFVYFGDVTAETLRMYMEEREDKCEALFVNRLGGRFNPNGVRFVLNTIASRAGVTNVHPHRFRRTCATTLNRNGMEIAKVARVLGHERIDTTMRYVNLDQSQVENDYHKYA